MDKTTNKNRQDQIFFFKSYKYNPPWDIGRPQKIFIRLAKELKKKGKMLDVGCGTGENTLLFARFGFDIIGIDYVGDAINEAIRKTKKRDIKAQFILMNAFELEKLNQKFDIVIDSGLFHTFSDSERLLFKMSLSKVISINGLYYMVCFSDLEPPGFGPRRIGKEEIYNTFKYDWNVISIEPAIFESTFGESKAWFAKIEHID